MSSTSSPHATVALVAMASTAAAIAVVSCWQRLSSAKMQLDLRDPDAMLKLCAQRMLKDGCVNQEVTKMIASGTDVNVEDMEGRTALFFCFFANYMIASAGALLRYRYYVMLQIL